MTSKKSLKIAGRLVALSRLINQSLMFYWGLYFTQIGLTGIQQGLLFMIFPVVSILSTIPIGLMSDRIYPRTLTAIGYLILGVEMLLVSQTTSFWHLAFLFIFAGLSVNFIERSLDSFFYKNSDSTQQKQVGGYLGMLFLGAGLGALGGGFLLDSIPFSELLIINGIISIGAAILSFIFLPHNEVFHFELNTYTKDLKRPAVILLSVLIFLWGIHMAAEMTSYGLFLREDLGLSFKETGLYMGSAIILMFFWSGLAGYLWHHNLPLRYIVYIGLILSGGGHIIMTHSDIGISFLGRTIHECGDAFMFVFMMGSIRKLFDKKRSGGNAGMIRFVQMSAIAIGSLLLAPIGETHGHSYPLIIGGILTLAALPIAMTFKHLIKN